MENRIFAYTCPNCGANIEPIKAGKCPYCGTWYGCDIGGEPSMQHEVCLDIRADRISAGTISAERLLGLMTVNEVRRLL